MKMKKLMLLLPIAAGIMFGSVGLFVRELTDNDFPNATILFVRTLFAAILIGIYLFFYDKSMLKIRIKDIPLFCGTGILGMMGLNLCYNYAINSLSLSLAAILLSTAPVFVIFLAAILFKEKITRRKIFCIALAIVGCIFASGILESQAGITVSKLGIMFGVAAAVFYALYSIFSRLATDKGYHSYTVIFYSVILISIVLLPVAELQTVGVYIAAGPLKNVLFLCVHSLCTSVLPYIFITLALTHVEAGKVSILASGGEPIAAVIFGILFYAEIPTLIMLVGLILTVLALSLLCSDKGEGHLADK